VGPDRWGGGPRWRRLAGAGTGAAMLAVFGGGRDGAGDGVGGRPCHRYPSSDLVHSYRLK